MYTKAQLFEMRIEHDTLRANIEKALAFLKNKYDNLFESGVVIVKRRNAENMQRKY